MPSARQPDRATLHVTGSDARHFLQNLITTELDGMPDAEARPGALLTPQGKILFDFLVSNLSDGIRLDIAASARDAFAKRLQLYRLRAKVEIAPSDEAVAAAWDTDVPGLRDMRFPDRAVLRLYGPEAEGADDEAGVYRAIRIADGVAEAEVDFPSGDVFPHDVLLDQNGGVSFRKGCFVGQEVVSRMQHRGTARRRIMVLRADSHITPGANVEAGGKTIGTVLSSADTVAMAMIRIDRLADALRADLQPTADGVAVSAEVPAWAGYALPEAGGSEEA